MTSSIDFDTAVSARRDEIFTAIEHPAIIYPAAFLAAHQWSRAAVINVKKLPLLGRQLSDICPETTPIAIRVRAPGTRNHVPDGCIPGEMPAGCCNVNPLAASGWLAVNFTARAKTGPAW